MSRVAFRPTLIVSLAMIMLLGLSAIPVVAAEPAFRPDARVLEPCHQELADCRPAWRGDNVYNTTAAGQTAEWFDCCGFTEPPVVVFRIRVQNDGTRSDRFTVRATGATSGYTVRFFRGSANITAAVRDGTYRTPILAPGAMFKFRAEVVKKSTARDRDSAVRAVSFTSLGNPNKKDTVKFVRELIGEACGC